MQNTKIIILCGGRGKRLGDITKQIPKPLVKLDNKPIIEHKIEYYKSKNFSDYIFCVGYKADILISHLKGLGINGKFSDAGENTGMLKRIYCTRESFSNQIIISYGDTYAEIDFEDLLNKHVASKSKLTLVAASIENPFGIIEWNEINKVTVFKEKPILNHYIGYAVMNSDLFNYIPKELIDLPNGKGIVKTIHYLTNKGLVNAYKFDGLQLTVNTNEELEYANDKIGKYYTLRESNEK